MKIGNFDLSKYKWILFIVIGIIILYIITKYIEQIVMGIFIVAILIGIFFVLKTLDKVNKTPTKKFDSPEEESAYKKKRAELEAQRDHYKDIKRKKEQEATIMSWLGDSPRRKRKNY